MSAVLTALQAALAAENAAVFGYGVAGGRLTGHAKKRARTAWAAHEAARDALIAMVTARGGAPVAAATTYRLPFPVHDPRSAASLAAYLEERLATAYLGVVALPEPALRAFGARGVRSAALRAADWRGSTVAFPGMRAASPPGRTGPPATKSPGAARAPDHSGASRTPARDTRAPDSTPASDTPSPAANDSTAAG